MWESFAEGNCRRSCPCAEKFCKKEKSPRWKQRKHHGAVEISPRWRRHSTMVEFSRHHGGVFTAPWWSGTGTVVFSLTSPWWKCGARRAESGKPAGNFQLSRATAHILRSEFFLHHGVFQKRAGFPNHHGGGFLSLV